MKKRTHGKILTFSPRHIWRGGLLLLALVLTTILIARAGASNPGFLKEKVSNISAGNHTYQIWYTTSCNGGSSSNCECDSAGDKDIDKDPGKEDLPNDCIATSDSDGDGVLNVMDLDWTNSGVGVVESTPRNVQRSVNRYVNTLGLKDPYWSTDNNRPVYVFDIGAAGRAFGDGSGEYFDASNMQRTDMDGRDTVAHELWHNEQYAYSAGGGSWLIEGQATILGDRLFQDLDRYSSTDIRLPITNATSEDIFETP